tara:strand:+ start:1541 stop:1945 length:405 start_codon:yes stop_codon:yes gene_type:complete
MIYRNEDIDINNKIDILPMIDIIFSILAFLIISSLYLTRIDTIPVDLPKASNVVNQKNKFINVSIDKSGNIFINKNIVRFEELKTNLLKFTDKSEKLIVLNADKNVPYGSVINVLDVLRGVEDLKITISTKFSD